MTMNGKHQKPITQIRRYTSLPILLDMLVNKKITLIDPASWEDRNDSFYVEKYREIKRLRTVLALCFTTRLETFHHWKVFAGNSGGVCVLFNAENLLTCFKKNPGIKTGTVTYKLVRDFKHNLPDEDDLPFLKRKQYEDEAEFRIIYENRNKAFQTKSFQLDLQCIERITLSPWLPYSVSETVKEVIRQIPGCASIEIIRTGVIENLAWKNVANKLA